MVHYLCTLNSVAGSISQAIAIHVCVSIWDFMPATAFIEADGVLEGVGSSVAPEDCNDCGYFGSCSEGEGNGFGGGMNIFGMDSGM